MPTILYVLLSLSVLLAATPAHAEPILAARVNGAGIAQERLERAFEEDLRLRRIKMGEIRYPDRVKRMKRAVLDNLIEQELFWQQARKAGLIAKPKEVDQAYEASKGQFKDAESFERRLRTDGLTLKSYRELLKKQLSARKYVDTVVAKAPAVSDADIHRFYLDNPDKFHRPELVRARNILVKVANGANAKGRAEKRSQIEKILKQARAGEDFAKLARQHSEAPTKQWGGEMDPIRRGQMAAPIEKVVFALAPGKVSDVLSVPGGFEILKVESHIEALTVGEDRAKGKIRDYLRQINVHRTLRDEIERLRASGKIEILLRL